jgi:hypothetical protein
MVLADKFKIEAISLVVCPLTHPPLQFKKKDPNNLINSVVWALIAYRYEIPFLTNFPRLLQHQGKQ